MLLNVLTSGIGAYRVGKKGQMRFTNLCQGRKGEAEQPLSCKSGDVLDERQSVQGICSR